MTYFVWELVQSKNKIGFVKNANICICHSIKLLTKMLNVKNFVKAEDLFPMHYKFQVFTISITFSHKWTRANLQLNFSSSFCLNCGRFNNDQKMGTRTYKSTCRDTVLIRFRILVSIKTVRSKEFLVAICECYSERSGEIRFNHNSLGGYRYKN